MILRLLFTFRAIKFSTYVPKSDFRRTAGKKNILYEFGKIVSSYKRVYQRRRVEEWSASYLRRILGN